MLITIETKNGALIGCKVLEFKADGINILFTSTDKNNAINTVSWLQTFSVPVDHLTHGNGANFIVNTKDIKKISF